MFLTFLIFLVCCGHVSPLTFVGKNLRTVRTEMSKDVADNGGFPSKTLIIWDCDGVLVDSEALLKQGEVEGLARAGISGVSVDEAASNFLKEKKRPLPEGFFVEQIAGSLQLFRERLVPLMTDTVMSLHGKGFEMCVASGSPLKRVELCLELAGIDRCFKKGTVYTRELVLRGKPAPDLFLYAAEKMNYSPDQCIVVEDSTAGIEAALAAGMRVIGYLGGGHAQAAWYRNAIESYDVPLAYTQDEVLEYLVSNSSR
jgi:HAD superfamily hydrolase (TIGR01509 family)